MILRCRSCGVRYAGADRFGPDPGAACPGCGALRERSERRCLIADRLGLEATCPPGGCQLDRLLEGREVGDSGDPCAVEALAPEQPDNPVVLMALDELRRELEGARGLRAGGRLAIAPPAGGRPRRTIRRRRSARA